MKDKLSEIFTICQVVLNRPLQVVRCQTYLDDVAVLHSHPKPSAQVWDLALPSTVLSTLTPIPHRFGEGAQNCAASGSLAQNLPRAKNISPSSENVALGHLSVQWWQHTKRLGDVVGEGLVSRPKRSPFLRRGIEEYLLQISTRLASLKITRPAMFMAVVSAATHDVFATCLIPLPLL